MTQRRLTAAFIRNTEPENKTRIYWDADVKGFGLRVTEGGSRAFVLQYRIDGRSRRTTLAQCSAISLRRAREVAGETLLSIRAGDDPLQRRQDAKAAPTIAHALDRFFGEYGPGLVNSKQMVAKTLADYRAQARRYIWPGIGNLKVANVRRRDVEQVLAKVPGKVQRNRVQALLSRLFTVFEDWEYRPPQTNPVFGIPKVREYARTRVFTPDEMKRMGRAFEGLDATHKAALGFLMLSGWRCGEVLSLEWGMIDEAGIISLPTSKTGPSRRTVSALAMAQVEGLPRTSAKVFGATTYRTLRMKFRASCRVAGVKDGRLHDVRRTFASVAAASGLNAFVLQRMLGHASVAMSSRYVQLAAPIIDDAQHATAGSIAAQLSGDDAEVEVLADHRKHVD